MSKRGLNIISHDEMEDGIALAIYYMICGIGDDRIVELLFEDLQGGVNRTGDKISDSTRHEVAEAMVRVANRRLGWE